MTGKLVQLYENEVAGFELKPSSGGVFEVRFGDELVFSKKALGRFPDEGEVEAKLAKTMTG